MTSGPEAQELRARIEEASAAYYGRDASIIDDAAQHSGQAVYTRRLLGLPG